MSDKYISPEHQIRNIMNRKHVVAEQTQQLDEFQKSAVKGLENTPVGSAIDFGLNLLTGRKPKSLAPAETPVEIPTAPKVEPEVKPQVKPETKPEVKPEAKPEAKPEVKPEAKPDAKLKPDVNVKPDANIKPQTKAKPEARPRPWTDLPVGGGVTPGQDIVVGGIHNINVKTITHLAADRRIFDSFVGEENEADKERRSIENVPRPKSDRNKAMARNESIKKKIIDENVKKKAIIKNAIDDKYSKSVEISPDIKSDKLTEAEVATNPKSQRLPDREGLLRGMTGGSLTGFGVGATVGAMYGDQMQQATNKALAPVDKFNPLLQKGTRDPVTGEYKLDKSTKGWGYDQTSVRDVLDTATLGAYPKIRAGVDTAVKTAGKIISDPSKTTQALGDIPKQYDIEQKQEKEKRDPANVTGRNTTLTNPENIGLDTAGNIMQAVPYRPVQLAGTALTGMRDLARGDYYNAALDIGGGLNPGAKLARTIGNPYVRRFVGNAIDQLPNALQAGQAGKAYVKDYQTRTEPTK